jgi:4-hydroxy-2-oxoheptanedioate aldolase
MKDIKKAIECNELVIGTMSISSHPAVIEMLGFAGFDFVVIDTEHGSAAPSSTELENLIRAAYAADITPFVRVNEIQQGMIEKALDFGAKGIVIPHLETVEEAQLCVRSAYFPTKGERGAARPVRAGRHGWDSWQTLLRRTNEETVLLPLIETVRGLENFEKLVQVEGIDAFMYGYFEMSLTMGYGGVQTENMIEHENRFYEICKQHAKPISDYRITIDESARVVQRGCTIMVYSADLIYTSEKFKEVARDLNVHVRKIDPKAG